MYLNGYENFPILIDHTGFKTEITVIVTKIRG